MIAVTLDQLSKWWIITTVMDPPRVIPITSFFNLVLGLNRGVSFGMFGTSSEIGRWVLTALALGITASLTVWLWRTKTMRLTAALALIIGGAIGNICDRVNIGAVVDFLDFHLGGYHWPAFNVADTGITIGAALIIAEAFAKDNPTGSS
tara:strand:- start:3632 stop:4078 length:447 start_codon:yes stop_codon:yes gene_type:complete